MWKWIKNLNPFAAELKNTKGLLDFARVALDEALAQLAERSAEVERLQAELAALRERAEQAEAERDDLNDETRIILELRNILGLKIGQSITMRCKQFATHAFIDVPSGVPSVEELDAIANDAWEDAAAKTTNNRERQHAMLSAIRDRILAGLAGEMTTGAAIQMMHAATSSMTRGEALGAVLASEDEVEALARVLWEVERLAECLITKFDDLFDSLRERVLNQARAAIAHMRKRPEGMPSIDHLEAIFDNAYGATKSDHNALEAVVAELTPYLRDPVGKPELDVTAEEIGKELEALCCDVAVFGDAPYNWDDEGAALIQLFVSRIRPTYECKECAGLKQRLHYAGDAWRRIVGYEANDALTAALEGE